MKKALFAMAALLATTLVHAPHARSLPLGFSVNGGIGYSYYSMADLNDHLNVIRQAKHIKLDNLGSGVGFRIDGRLWLFHMVALTGGYEHLWAESESQGSSSVLSFKAPADVFLVGVTATVLRVENVLDLCIGVSRSSVQTVYGTNEFVDRWLAEYKGKGTGYEAFGEIHTNFIDPIEVGFQVGYRGLKIGSLNDKWGVVGVFDDGTKMTIDYSGFFFYMMTAIRI